MVVVGLPLPENPKFAAAAAAAAAMLLEFSMAWSRPFLRTSSLRDLPYLPRTYIKRELYGMPNMREACDI